MRDMIKVVTILALLGSRDAIAETVGPATSSVVSSSSAAGRLSLAQRTRLIDEAPVGHRQPRARDVPSQSPAEIERLAPEDAAIDRKLVICRGC